MVCPKTSHSAIKKNVESIQQRGAKVIIGDLRFTNKDRGFGRGYEKIAEQTENIGLTAVICTRNRTD